MQFQFSFKRMETSTALKNYTEEKLKTQIRKFVTKPIEAHVTFSVDRHHNIAQCSLKAGDGFKIEVQHSCGDMYGSVDRMLDKLFTQLKRKKDRLKGHKGNRNFKSLKYKDPDTIDYNSAEIDAADIVAWEERRKAS